MLVNDKLYYVCNGDSCVGYIIVDCSDNTVVEFSTAPLSPYDNIDQETGADYLYIYNNGIPIIYSDGFYFFVSMDGNLSFYKSENAGRYYPNLQSGNCIVGAISNLMWHYGKNGYAFLISGMTFNQVEAKVDSYMTALGGYTNANIPNTIGRYVQDKSSSYTPSVQNKWNPSFTDVSNEVSSRPCLLGFAASSDSPYGPKAGHMTVCVGTSTVSGIKYVSVMDGWKTEVTQRQWNTNYNDFMSKVTIFKLLSLE